MPWAAPTVCRQPGCRLLVKTAGYCDAHRAAAHKAYNALRKAKDLETDRWYHTSRWRKLRAEVLAVEPNCRRCAEEGIIFPALLVDHITPVKQGGSFWSKGNLQPLCNRCHEAKSHAEGSRFFSVRIGPR
jgi:5-methylcytosine-specific restriction protein A